MSSKQKTSVRTSAKDTNKGKTSKAAKAAPAPASEPEATAATTLAPDAAAPAPATSKGKRGKAAKGEPSPAPTPKPTGEAFAEDGRKVTVSIPAADDDRVSLADLDRSKRKAAKQPKAAKPAKEPKVKKVSGLDAAAIVLAESAAPMKATDMLAEIQKRGLWASKGATPEATLYAAIIREIAAKGELSRFKKHDRGLFVATFPVGKGA